MSATTPPPTPPTSNQEEKISRVLETQTENKDNSLWLKVFLIDSSVNKNDWKLSPQYIEKHIDKFVGKPFILTASRDHPLFSREGVKPGLGQKTLDQILAVQEKYKIGEIKKVERDAKIQSIYNAYIQITNPKVIEAFKKGNIPYYVSPAIFDPAAHDDGKDTKDFYPIHIAAVDHPAYGLKAYTKGACEGDEGTCLPELKTASDKKRPPCESSCPCDILETFEHKFIPEVKTASSSSNSSYHENQPLNTDSLSNLEKPESFIAEITPTNPETEQLDTNTVNPTPTTEVPKPEVVAPNTVPQPQEVQNKDAPVPAVKEEAVPEKLADTADEKIANPKGTKSKAELVSEIENLKATLEEISNWKKGIQENEVKKAAEEQRAQVEQAITLDVAGGDEQKRQEYVNFITSLNVPQDKLATLLALITGAQKQPEEQVPQEQNQVRTASVNQLILSNNNKKNPKQTPSYFSRGFFGKL